MRKKCSRCGKRHTTLTGHEDRQFHLCPDCYANFLIDLYRNASSRENNANDLIKVHEDSGEGTEQAGCLYVIAGWVHLIGHFLCVLISFVIAIAIVLNMQGLPNSRFVLKPILMILFFPSWFLLGCLWEFICKSLSKTSKRS